MAGPFAAAPAHAAFPGRSGLIAFIRNGNIYTSSATGGSVKQITKSGGLSGPHWSPDGKRLAYADASGNVFVRTMTTGRTIKVGTGAVGASGPVWSGDGSRVAWIAYYPADSVTPCDEESIATAPRDGSAPATRLVNYDIGDSDWCSYPPSIQIGGWSPDNKSILLTETDGHQGIGKGLYLLNLTAGRMTHLVEVNCDGEDVPTGACTYPTMSPATFGPKGIKILFSMSGGYVDQVIPPFYSTVPRVYSLDAPTGTNFHQVSTGSGYDPVSSPDGSWALYTTAAGVTTNIMRTGLDATSKPKLLIKNASQPDWQPAH
ncbi:MAG: hypothetical protein QM747_12845 [Nocardioides sp.]